MPAKSIVHPNRGVTVAITGAICEKDVIGLMLRKPKTVQKKASGTKKHKRGNGKTDEVEVNAQVGIWSEHFLDFLSSLMGILDQFDMHGRDISMDNATIHKVNDVQE